MDFLKQQWNSFFPFGLFVTKESTEAIAMENKFLSIPNLVVVPKMKNFGLIPSEDTVVGGIYIGALWCACNQEEIFSNNIKTVINCTANLEGFTSYHKSVERLKQNLQIEFARVSWKDTEDEVLEKDDLEGAIKYIHSKRIAGESVLVHCAMGKSRSATLVIAYMLAYGTLDTVEKCLEVVAVARPGARPNDNFINQLNTLHSSGFFTKKVRPQLAIIHNVEKYYIPTTKKEGNAASSSKSGSEGDGDYELQDSARDTGGVQTSGRETSARETKRSASGAGSERR